MKQRFLPLFVFAIAASTAWIGAPNRPVSALAGRGAEEADPDTDGDGLISAQEAEAAGKK